MKRKLLGLTLALSVVFTGCSSSTSTSGETKQVKEKETLTIAWYPNESGADLKEGRDEIGKLVEQATGKKVEHKTTTDYAIAIEAIANGSADVAFMGAQGYIEAHNKNKNVVPLVVSTGKSGTLTDAIYHSWLGVKQGNEDEYKKGDGYAIDNIAGKKFSFVSNSSTSGFKVPSTEIVNYFSKQDKYKDLKPEDLLEGGKFFSQVLYGGSHQGSAVNVLSGKADVGAFCDTCVANYVKVSEGKENTPGAVYEVNADAAEPFNTVTGQKFVIVSVTPVLNAPFVVNKDTLTQETIDKLTAAMTSDETANNQKIFVPKDAQFKGLFAKTDKEKFMKVEDSWFEPIRELSK